jgi:hypothetical protein
MSEEKSQIVKIKDFFFSRYLIEYKLCMNYQMGDSGTGGSLVIMNYVQSIVSLQAQVGL